MIKDVLVSHNLPVDKNAFDEEVENAKIRSRSATTFIKNTEWSKYIAGIVETKFIGYQQFESQDSKLLKDFQTDQGQRVLIFDKTPFYATGGGQVSDFGTITLDSGEEVYVKEVIKYA